MQKDLKTWLRSHGPLAAILGEHNSRPAIDWVMRPNQGKLPAITLSDISQARSYEQQGVGELVSTRVQIDVWSSRYGHGVDIMKIVIPLLEGGKTQGNTEFKRGFLEGGPRSLSGKDLPGGQRIHHYSADFILWHEPI